MHEAEIADIKFPSYSEYSITIQPFDDPYRRLRSVASKRKAVILSQSVFAANPLYFRFASGAGQAEWPVVWIQGDACKDGGCCSLQAVALSGKTPQPVCRQGRTVGFVYEDDYARYCRLCGLLPADRAASRSRQARSAFENASAVLEQNGFRFSDTVRTWIYLDHLLEWYEDFNAVRTGFFKETGILDHTLPASTAVGAANPWGAVITLDVFAVQPKKDLLRVQAVASPLQNPPLEYRSSFSRAVELRSRTHRRLLVSGTAGIAPDGRTAFPGEPEKQIRLAMVVVKAILESRGMDGCDLRRGIAYFTHMAHIQIYRRVASELKIPRFPLALVHADICRRDLVFEIEADAVQICSAEHIKDARRQSDAESDVRPPENGSASEAPRRDLRARSGKICSAGAGIGIGGDPAESDELNGCRDPYGVPRARQAG